MTYAPVVTEMQAIQQGGGFFFPVPGWIDHVASTSSHAEYDVAAARTAMGFSATQSLFVEILPDGPTYVNAHAVAAVPGTATVDGSAPMLLSQYAPTRLYLDQSITSLSFISAAAQKVNLRFFRP